MGIKGGEKLRRTIRNLKRKARELDGAKRDVPLKELFPPAFMAEHTEFADLQAMFDASGLFQRKEDTVRDLGSQAWSDFVASRTRFGGWREMEVFAARQWTRRQLKTKRSGSPGRRSVERV